MFLYQNFDPFLADDNGWMQFHHHARNGSYQMIKLLADMGINIHLTTNDGKNCLHIAALNGHLNLCKTLINKHNFDIDMADNEGFTVLHFSAINGGSKLVNFFMNKIADLHIKTRSGGNCLHIAAITGNLNLCKKLVDKHNIDVHVADNNGFTALHYSAEVGNYQLVKFFVDKGTDIQIKTDNGMNCLHIAASKGYSDLCKRLINNFDVYMTDNDGWTALHHSAFNGSYDLVNYFIDKGANILFKTKDGWNCFHTASLSGHVSICNTLINKHNFDVNVVDNNGLTSLHLAALNGSYELVKFFADNGTNIQLKTKNEINCLHLAAVGGHLKLCKILINKHSFDVNQPMDEGFTAIHFSAQSGRYELFNLFAENGADVSAKSEEGLNSLHIAAFNGYVNLCKALIYKHNFDVLIGNNFGFTALHYSAEKGSYELVKFFVDMGTDIFLKTKNGNNCLHVAAFNGHLDLCKTLVNKHNFDVDMTDHEGLSALHHSVKSGKYELVKFFADKVADIHAKTKFGENCLHFTAFSGNLYLCKTLVNNHKFDVHVTDTKGFTALHYSAQNGNYKIVKFFADIETDIFLKTKNGRNCLHIAAFSGNLMLCKTLINKHKFDVHMTDNDGLTALHHSVQSGNYELMKFFADRVGDIHAKTKSGENCLHFAAISGHLNLCKTLIKKDQFDPHMTNNNGWSGLHCAAQNGSYELVKFFIDKGTDILLKTKFGTNCLMIAAFNGHLNLCKTLINKHNYDLYMTDNMGSAALHCSAINGSYELVKFFADKVDDIFVKTKLGMNCLHLAAANGHLNLCKTLIKKYHFDVLVNDDRGWKPLHFSVQNGSPELVNFFVDMGTNIYLTANDGTNCLHIASLNGNLSLCKTFLENHKFDVLSSDNNDWTPLHCSSKNGNFELFSYLLEKGSEIYCKTKEMRNVLHLSAGHGHFDICKFVLNYFIKDYGDNNTKNQYALYGQSYRSKIFYEYNQIFFHAMDVDGNTYLHLAADGNHSKVCEILLNYDIEVITLLNKNDETARDIAKKNGYEDVLKVLKAQYDRVGTFTFFIYTY